MEKKNVYDIFIHGMQKGWRLGTMNLLPNIIMAFVLIQLLNTTGILNILGEIFQPVMGIFDLPGASITVLLATWLSAGGGIGVAASLYEQGILTNTHLSIIIPGIFLMGAQIQYMGRVLAVAGVNTAHYIPMFIISVCNTFMAMLTMRYLVV